MSSIAELPIVARIEKSSWSLACAALLLIPLELATVSVRTELGAPSLLSYAATSVVVAGWLCVLVGAAFAALATLGHGLLERTRLAARARLGLSLVAVGLLCGFIAVLAIKPWALRSDPLHFALSVPLGCVVGAFVLRLSAHWLGRTPFSLGLAVVAFALFVANAFLYRGLYLTLHRAALWLSWVALAYACSLWLERSSPGWLRVGPLVLFVLAHAGMGKGESDRELGVLHGSLAPTAAAVLRSMADRDGDGYAAYWGGGDCDDGDPEVHPGQCEVPGNGRDDNCNGRPEASLPRPPKDEARVPRTPMPDVYFIVVDTLRGDFGGPPGRARRSPSLHELASHSLDFARAYAPYPATFRSMTAMVQSRSPRNVRDGLPDLVSLLAQHGFDAQVWIGAERLRANTRDWPPTRARHPFHAISEADPDWSEALLEAAIRELREPSPAPRFRWLHLLDLHGPWQHAPERGDARERYVAELAHVERLLARLFSALASEPRGRDAALVVLGDHGEQLGEHGALFHDAFVWEQSVHVPLIMRLNGVAPRRVESPASLIDVAPTLLHYLGLGAPDSFEGHDWLRAPERRDSPPVVEVGESAVGDSIGPPARHAVIGERYKLSANVSENLLELYDLQRDPGESRPLHRELVPQAGPLWDALVRFQDHPDCLH